MKHKPAPFKSPLERAKAFLLGQPDNSYAYVIAPSAEDREDGISSPYVISGRRWDFLCEHGQVDEQDLESRTLFSLWSYTDDNGKPAVAVEES